MERNLITVLWALVALCVVLLGAIGVVVMYPPTVKIDPSDVAKAMHDQERQEVRQRESRRGDGLLGYVAIAEAQPIRQNREVVFLTGELFQNGFQLNSKQVPEFTELELIQATDGLHTLEKHIGGVDICWKIRWDHDDDQERLPWSLHVSTDKRGYDRYTMERLEEEWRRMGPRLPEGAWLETSKMIQVARGYLEFDLKQYGDKPGVPTASGIKLVDHSNEWFGYTLKLEKKTHQDRFELCARYSPTTPVEKESFLIYMLWYPPPRNVRP